ncbi:hypothetical protein BJV82DRAFT_663596 [Fennellomyces sp. T-0311]|nr:hypothetical protein BJV82DRAFT_663596 [Fennellomyces sp. T-0311]
MVPNPALRELCLLDMPMSNEGLFHLADLPSSRVLVICTINGNIDTKGLLGLARKLRGKPLESLSLIHVECLEDAVLYELEAVEHLSNLHVANNGCITDNGSWSLSPKARRSHW